MLFRSQGATFGKQRPRPDSTKSRKRPQVELLEDRLVPAGTWSSLANPAQVPVSTMLLMTDGTVMATDGGSGWYRLTPDASGSYANGTWSTVAPMHDTRLYDGSVVLPDGRLFVAGGEYGTGGNTAEIYDPVTNTWTYTAPPLTSDIGDSTAQLLPGHVLVAERSDARAEIYDPASNTWTFAGDKLGGDANDEESLTLLPDGTLLTVDVWDAPNAQKYVPSENRWVSAGTLPASLVGPGYEMGAGLLLPDGRAFLIGGNGLTAYYTPGANPDDPGSWQMGPSLPGGVLADDAPAAVLPNGHVLLEGDAQHFGGPTSFFDFDPTTNTYTSLPAPDTFAGLFPAYLNRMLVLPTGQVLFTGSVFSILEVYTPDSGANPAWQPTIGSVTANGDGSYHVTGTLLNGVSNGAAYGDDAQMSTNYPIFRLVDASNNVFYGRSSGFGAGVGNGAGTSAADFTPPTGLAPGTYSLYAVANGIASAPYTFTIGTVSNQLADPGFELPDIGNGTFGDFVYDPTGSPWTFSGGAGVSGNGSGFTSGNPDAPEGDQVAFLQGTGSASQSFTLAAGTYTVSFQAAQRQNYQASIQTFQVLIDGTVVGTFTPADVTYTTLTTDSFTVDAGTHTLTFVGLDPNGGDNTAFIDAVQVNVAQISAPALTNAGFETPNLGTGDGTWSATNYQYNPTGAAWDFSGSSGITGNGSGFTFGNADAPEGTQVAFLQGTGSFSQSVNFAQGGAFTIGFQAAQRGNWQASAQTFEVLVDGNVVGTFTPAGTGYAAFTTNPFTVGVGSHTIAFAGLNPNGGDNTAFIDAVQVTAVAAIGNAGFEAPAVGNGTFGAFAYNPTGTAWTFTGGAGVSGNGSGFTAGNPDAPDGTQVAFLQGSGSFTQTLNLAAGTYTISFQAAQRQNYQASSQTFQVLIDGTVVGTFTPSDTAYASFTSDSFTLAAGSHTLMFVGVNPNGGDNTAFIDAVSLDALPTAGTRSIVRGA
jgi:archaellum component FlaG (FlaF/FlaG flagellin family)